MRVRFSWLLVGARRRWVASCELEHPENLSPVRDLRCPPCALLVCHCDSLGIALMGTPLRSLALVLAVVAANGHLAEGAPEGSKLAPSENACATCHGEAESWEGYQLRLHIPAEEYADDVHRQKGVNCHDCHGGDPTVLDPGDLHAAKDGFRKLADVKKSCVNCHEEQVIGLVKGVHAKAGARNERGEGTPMDCGACHGANLHRIYPAADGRSPVFPNNQVQVCGECHQEHLETYSKSVHGNGLFESGLTTTAVCASCHGAHDICYAADKRSTLHPSKVADTCGQCHRFIKERLQASVHGNGPGEPGEAGAPAKEGKRKPSCTDCHEGHDVSHPDFSPFRFEVSNRCGNCHVELSSHYALSLHGELTQLGYAPAAKCADCHGAHDILPVSHLNSTLSPANRQETCAQCHPRAAGNFLDFDPHADHRSLERDPLLFGVYAVLLTFLFSTFGVFGLHSLLWFARGLVDVSKHGRPKALSPGTTAYVRFGTFHRVGHTVMVVSFLGLAATGLPLKYSEVAWAHALANALGGFESTAVWHRIFGMVNIGCLAVYVFRMLGRLAVGPDNGGSRIGQIFGPDSPAPNLRDLRDFFKMLRWFLGRGPKPTFERWAYWGEVRLLGSVRRHRDYRLDGPDLVVPQPVLRIPSGQRVERRQSHPFDAGALGHRVRLCRPLLRHASPPGKVPDGHVGPHRAGHRGGSARGTARVPRTDAPDRQAGRAEGDRSFAEHDPPHCSGRIRRPGDWLVAAGRNSAGSS